MEISNIYALIWLGLKIVYLYYLPIEISIYKSNKTTSIVNGSSITSQEAQSGNLARISVLMYIIVQICHKIYILKWNLLVYLIVCVLLFIFLFCWTNINFQRLCSLHLMFACSRPVWKVCIAQLRYQTCNVDAFYIFTIKFSKSQLCNFQTFQSGRPLLVMI
jgi:hypothetical protein